MILEQQKGSTFNVNTIIYIIRESFACTAVLKNAHSVKNLTFHKSHFFRIYIG